MSLTFITSTLNETETAVLDHVVIFGKASRQQIIWRLQERWPGAKEGPIIKQIASALRKMVIKVDENGFLMATDYGRRLRRQNRDEPEDINDPMILKMTILKIIANHDYEYAPPTKKLIYDQFAESDRLQNVSSDEIDVAIMTLLEEVYITYVEESLKLTRDGRRALHKFNGEDYKDNGYPVIDDPRKPRRGRRGKPKVEESDHDASVTSEDW